ncbi:hypothetical protein ABE26_24670 [Cytobacillus firmus]|nr:hypothetical protein [Cytobacillus firmus]
MYEGLGKLLTIYTKRYAFFPGIMIHRFIHIPITAMGSKAIKKNPPAVENFFRHSFREVYFTLRAIFQF